MKSLYKNLAVVCWVMAILPIIAYFITNSNHDLNLNTMLLALIPAILLILVGLIFNSYSKKVATSKMVTIASILVTLSIVSGLLGSIIEYSLYGEGNAILGGILVLLFSLPLLCIGFIIAVIGFLLTINKA